MHKAPQRFALIVPGAQPLAEVIQPIVYIRVTGCVIGGRRRGVHNCLSLTKRALVPPGLMAVAGQFIGPGIKLISKFSDALGHLLICHTLGKRPVALGLYA